MAQTVLSGKVKMELSGGLVNRGIVDHGHLIALSGRWVERFLRLGQFAQFEAPLDAIETLVMPTKDSVYVMHIVLHGYQVATNDIQLLLEFGDILSQFRELMMNPFQEFEHQFIGYFGHR
jgi:hypothetical protein